MIVKVAPLGEIVVSVNVAENTSIKDVLAVAKVEVNGRSITLNNAKASGSTAVHSLDNGNVPIIVLASAMKGGM